MASKYCTKCGKDRDIKGGKFCPNDHFVCGDHVKTSMMHIPVRDCPVCGKRLQ